MKLNSSPAQSWACNTLGMKFTFSIMKIWRVQHYFLTLPIFSRRLKVQLYRNRGATRWSQPTSIFTNGSSGHPSAGAGRRHGRRVMRFSVEMYAQFSCLFLSPEILQVCHNEDDASLGSGIAASYLSQGCIHENEMLLIDDLNDSYPPEPYILPLPLLANNF